MSIQPIDLQTMYKQLGNISQQVANQQQGQQMAQAAHLIQNQKQIINEKNRVQQTGDAAASSIVNKDGKNSDKNDSEKKKDKKNKEIYDPDNPYSYRSKEDYLGQNVDVVR